MAFDDLPIVDTYSSNEEKIAGRSCDMGIIRVNRPPQILFAVIAANGFTASSEFLAPATIIPAICSKLLICNYKLLYSQQCFH